jgi:hypothetical protein
MPLASKRVLSIILEECREREDRFPGYQRELVETLSEIIQLERDHRVQGMNIKQRVADKIGALGRLIAEAPKKK